MKLGKYLPLKYLPLMLALCVSIFLIAVSIISVRFIYAHDRANVSHHILTRLQATNGLLELWQHNYLQGVKALAEDPSLVKLVDDLINHKISNEDASKTMDQWLRPIYLGRGYDGHSVISPDFQIVLSSSPAYTGKTVASPVSRAAISKALGDGSAISRPIESNYQITMFDKVAEAGTLFQLGCARIQAQGKTLAVLCLRQNPYHDFFAMLSTGFSGASGEAYAVDRNGYIISPTRFGQAVIRNKTESSEAPTYVKGLQARIPSRVKTGQLVTSANSPLTRAVTIAMRNGESGFVDGYQDYRGVAVVGAVQWVANMDVGIVVEQDVDEVYAPFQFSCNTIIGFTALAILLINILMFVMVRGRKSLAEREQSMRAFLDNFPGLAHMRDRKGSFMIVNKQMEELLHIRRRDIIGHSDDILVLPQKHITQLNRDHEEVLRTGEVLEAIREIADLKYEKVEWVKTIRFPIFDPETKAIYAVGTILLNITEQIHSASELEAIRINLENMVAQRTVQLETAKLDAEQAAHAKSDFLANMSHEIRTPMNAIIGLSHLATLVSDDPKLRSYLQRIHQSSTHLLSIINDILDFSKIEAGKMIIDSVDFSLEDMLNNVLGLQWEKADAKGIELLLQIDPELPDNMKGDALRIGQILINFTNNAVKFTETGNVVVRVRKVADNLTSLRVRFDVEDTGIGIPSEQFDQLFQPFHQLDTSSTRRFEGTGLGLTISKNLVELMGGELSISSEQGVGSTFSLELNLAHGSQLDLPALHAPVLKGKRVLVVDDNEQACNIVADMLRKLTMDVTCADSGAAALALIHPQDGTTHEFDIVFIDWKMPGLSGIETAEQILMWPQVRPAKLVLLSAHSKHGLSPNAENLFAAIISKPILASALSDTVTKLFKNTYVRAEHNVPLDLTGYKKLAGSRVLLVDDNEINQDVVKELLYLVGVKVITASNGQQALDLLDRLPFDAVLMDVQMPVMDGLEATRRLRLQNRFVHLPIIALTASALSGDRERCLAVGMNDYISKPIYPETLYRTLLRWHSRRNAPTPEVDLPVATIRPTETTSELTRVLSRLYRVEGLDVDQALERLLNNETLYLKLIKRFINERSDIVDVIETALAEKNISDALHQAHSFKSLAGTIGAVELQALALQLELELQQEKSVENLLPAMRVALNSLLEELRAGLNI
jgi:signal transduction histidine kinase/CheY-like chemotaxis protein